MIREHVDLIGFLDYEIWKASYMLALHLPLHSCVNSNDELWEEFDLSSKDDKDKEEK